MKRRKAIRTVCGLGACALICVKAIRFVGYRGLDSAVQMALCKENIARDAGLLETANRTCAHMDVSEDLLQAIGDWALQARLVGRGADRRDIREPLWNGTRVKA